MLVGSLLFPNIWISIFRSSLRYFNHENIPPSNSAIMSSVRMASMQSKHVLANSAVLNVIDFELVIAITLN